MYVNKCTKCGREFETKNPKRVICPDCLYPDKKMIISSTTLNDTENSVASEGTKPLPSYSTEEQPQFYSSYSAGEGREPQQNSGRDNRPQGGYNRNYNSQRPQGGYNRTNNNYRRPQQGGYNRDNRQQGGYNRNYNSQRSQGGFNRQGGSNNRYNNNRPQNNRFNRRPANKAKAPKQLLVSREQLEQIELLYKAMLPLPNPDAHEVIGEKIGLEPRKVFFGINLVRQKMMLPKLPFPKRKLAISSDQLFAIKNLYEPLLPLPPIGCHKIIAAQLKMDEWRVHVGIGLIRSQMGLERWNQDREDAPAEFRTQKEEATATEEKPKRGRKPKKEAE